MLIYSWKPFPS